MLNATDAAELSTQGEQAREAKRLLAEEARKADWLKAQEEKLPGLIEMAERAVKSATTCGERATNTGIRFIEGRDYTTSPREGLCKPHQDLLTHFEKLGYTVELKYEWEPVSNQHSSSWCKFILKW